MSKITDAKFKVIKDPNRVRWWEYRLSFDWRVFWICAAVSTLAGVRWTMDALLTNPTAQEQVQTDAAPGTIEPVGDRTGAQ